MERGRAGGSGPARQAGLQRDAQCKPGTRAEAPLVSLDTYIAGKRQVVSNHTWPGAAG